MQRLAGRAFGGVVDRSGSEVVMGIAVVVVMSAAVVVEEDGKDVEEKAESGGGRRTEMEMETGEGAQQRRRRLHPRRQHATRGFAEQRLRGSQQ